MLDSGQGVIVVDAGRSQSTCLGRDAYIHDHCLGYRHNYALFYQLLNSNLFTHRMLSFKGEASSENYGHWVYLLSYLTLLLIFYIHHYEISSLEVTMKGLTTPLSRWLRGSCLYV